MKDQGLNKGLVQEFETSNRRNKGIFYGFRKMFWDFLKKLNVPFRDACCDDADGTLPAPVGYSSGLQYFNGTTWVSAELSLNVDTISEQTAGAGVTVDGVLLKDSEVTTDVIHEKTAATGVTADGVLLKDGGVSANSMFAGFFPTTAAQALSGAGAVNVTSYLTKFTSTGASQALTLASGTQIGQRKRVSHVVDGGSGVLTAAFVGGTTITFTTVAEYADLIWTGSAWAVLELANSAVPGTPPALA